MKKIVIAAIAATALLLGWFAVDAILERRNASASVETESAQRGDLMIVVEAAGVVRSNQHARLRWRTNGTVEDVYTGLGDKVVSGELLANLEQSSLPPSIILAQADLVNAQRDLENLQSSQVKSAQKQQEVEQARQALEDASDPALTISRAQTALAEAQKAYDTAERNYEILTRPPSKAAIDQTNANLLLAEKRLNNTLRQLDRVRRRATKPEDKLMFFESRELYKRILEGLELKELQDRRAYEDSLSRYNRLVEPPSPNDVAVAEAELARATAQLAQAQLDWERDQAGTSPADLAVLEARLADAQREWELWKDGPDTGEIASTQAHITAAQAALDMVKIEAPFGGTITGAYARPGDQVGEGDQAFRLDDLSRLLIDASISEIDISKIKIGQNVILTFDAIPGREYTGRIVEVPQVGEVVQDVANFNIVIEISDPDESIRPEMTASANVVIELLENVLLVPNSALRLLDGERVVYILRDGNILPTVLTLGSKSGTYSEVVSGDLEEGDQILLNPKSSD
jgi:HlyD family secretion protein